MPVSDPDVSRTRLIRDARFLEADRREIWGLIDIRATMDTDFQLVSIFLRFPQADVILASYPLTKPPQTIGESLTKPPHHLTSIKNK